MHRFEEIKKDLHVLGCKESSFLKVELLFYEVLDISRSYGSDPGQNSLLAALREVQYNQYEKTKIITRRQGQRELYIRQFIVKLKKVLSGH
jgi:hypothetical protein